MRPYLAIIKDSFREALASRVLWILLAFLTLVLAAIAPIGFFDQPNYELNSGDVKNGDELIKRMVAQFAAAEPSPGKRIFGLLPKDLQDRFQASSANPATPQQPLTNPEVRAALVPLLNSRDLYDQASWAGVEIGAEARELVSKGVARLGTDDRGRLNRLLLEAAFPEQISASGETGAVLSYLGIKLAGPWPVKAEPMVRAALAGFMSIFLGILGVFCAILVTASIIPNTFEQGAIDLLLSKPVSRWLVYLSKFVGGCAFTLINAAYMIVGLFLIAGWRFHLWSTKLLLCIPLFMFLFAIYYSVSALAGVIWRNAIVCVVMTILFWLACFVVGTAHVTIEEFVLGQTRLVRIVRAGDAQLAIDERQQSYRWNPDIADWETVFEPNQRQVTFGPPPPPVVGPVYDARTKDVIAILPGSFNFGGYASGTNLSVGNERENWRRVEGVRIPGGTFDLMTTRDRQVLATTPSGVYRMEGSPISTEKKVKLLFFDVPMGSVGDSFVLVSPALRLKVPCSSAIDPISGEIVLVDQEEILLLEPNREQGYSIRLRRRRTDKGPTVVAYAGDTIVLAHAKGQVKILDAKNLNERQELTPSGTDAPRFAQASPDGRWLFVLFHTRRLWLYDARMKQPISLGISGRNGDVSAASFTAEGHLLVADYYRRIIEYQLDPFQEVARFQPPSTLMERIERFGVGPLYYVFPKPGDLDNMIRYLLTDETTVAGGREQDNLAAGRIHLDIWGPVWSSLAFLGIVLLRACQYVQRKDF